MVDGEEMSQFNFSSCYFVVFERNLRRSDSSLTKQGTHFASIF